MKAGLEKTIVIKKGVKVMLKLNIDVSLGLFNGAIGIVDKSRTGFEQQELNKKSCNNF